MIYGAILLVLCGLGLTNESSQKKVLFYVIAFLFVFMGLRYEVGCDFWGYKNRFDAISRSADPTAYLTIEEPAFQYLTAFVRTSGLDYMWLNIISTAIMLAGIAVFLRTFARPLTTLALLFPITIVQLSMSGLRQGIASALLMASANPFVKGHRLATALLILVGSQFHTSVAIFLPIAFLAGRTISLWRLVGAIVLWTPVALYVMGSQLEEYTDQYITQIYGEVSSNGAVFRYAFALMPAIVLMTGWKSFQTFAEEEPGRFNLLGTFAIITVCMAPMALISSLALHRMTFYVLPFSCALLVYEAYIFNIYDCLRSIHVGLIMSLIYFTSWMFLSRHANDCYTPYKNYLFM